LFLHYAFDEWMQQNNKNIPFERYADDILVHCVSEKQALWLKTVIEKRLNQCGLELHPGKMRIVEKGQLQFFEFCSFLHFFRNEIFVMTM